MKIQGFVLLYLLVISGIAMAQPLPQENIPLTVMETFHAKFPTATGIAWAMSGDDYRVAFEFEGRDHTAFILHSGLMTKHVADFPETDLPEKVLQRAISNFNGYRIVDVDKIDIEHEHYYQLKLTGSAGNRTVSITEDGVIKSNTPD